MLPPPLFDCKGNSINFNLDPKLFEYPEPLKKWNEWIKDDNNKQYLALEMEWDLSKWDHPLLENNSYSKTIICEYKFENKNWESCNSLFYENISVPKSSTKLIIKLDWYEFNNFNNELIIEYEISQNKIKEIYPITIDYVENQNNVLIVNSQNNFQLPVILFSESKNFAFVNNLNEAIYLDNTTMPCESEKYEFMSLDLNKTIQFEMGSNPITFDEDDLTIYALSFNSSWEKIIEYGNITSLILKNENEGHELSLPLKNFNSLELHGFCENTNGNISKLVHNGIFLMWSMLSIIMIIMGLAILIKKRNLINNLNEEES